MASARLQRWSVLLYPSSHCKQWSRRDPTIAKLVDLVQHGWQLSSDAEMKPYHDRKNELSLSVMTACYGEITWSSHKLDMSNLFHKGHPGASHMKSLARLYIWWPGIDGEIETKVKSCHTCQQNHNSPPPVTTSSLGVSTTSLGKAAC